MPVIADSVLLSAPFVQRGVQTALFMYADLVGGMLHSASRFRVCRCSRQGKLCVIQLVAVHVVHCTAVRLHPATCAA